MKRTSIKDIVEGKPVGLPGRYHRAGQRVNVCMCACACFGGVGLS